MITASVMKGLKLEHILFVTLLTINHYYSKLELRFSEEAMKKFKQISYEHTHEFNAIRNLLK